MAQSAEHEFISASFADVLNAFSATKLMGVNESDRKRFDYSCVIERDCSRPVVSQVLWRHAEGIDKDLRMLLHDNEALIKTYFVRDSVKHRLRIDEVISDYRQSEETYRLLSGLKVIFLPPDFDADKDQDRLYMSKYLSGIICNDLLFCVAFGNLSRFEIDVFLNHGGPLGLKFAILDEITKNGLTHTPTFKQRLGYSTNSPIREATTMLAAAGLVKRIPRSVMLLPTLKGRMLLDLTKRILFEKRNTSESSTTLSFPGELESIVTRLMPGSVIMEDDQNDNGMTGMNALTELIVSAEYCYSQFGRDLLENTSGGKNRKFYDTYDWRRFYEEVKGVQGLTPEFFSDPDSHFFTTPINC